MIANAPDSVVLINTGVKVGSKYDGKHQGALHIRDGVYWEAMYSPSDGERLIQAALLDKRYPDTRKRLEDIVFKVGTLRG
jgi:hypothetical protein